VRGLAFVANVAVVVLALVIGGDALADTSAQDKTTAQALYDEGRRLMGEKKYADACASFVGSQRLDPAVGTLLNLAVCYDKNGQTASAWATFKDAAAMARDAGQADREKFARGEAAKLEPLLARLTIVVPKESVVDGLVLATDGSPMQRAGWGLATPVDPGEHRVEARAPGKKPWSSAVTIAAKEQRSVSVPPLEDLPAPPPPPPPTASATAPPPASTTPPPPPPPATTIVHIYEPPPDTPGSAQRTWGVVAGVFGVVAVSGSIVFGELLAKRKYDKSNQSGLCTNNVCLPEGQQYRDDAFTAARVATYVFAGGAAFVVGGVVLYVTAPSAKQKPTTGRVTVSPVVGPNGAGMSLGGAW
jgi:serine/threonine-protein kinase